MAAASALWGLPRNLSRGQTRALKTGLFVALALPFTAAIYGIFTQTLPTSEPIDYLTRQSGENALRLLVAVLCVTPLRRATNWNFLLRLRRMLGVFMFFYALCHFSVYLVLDRGLDVSTVIEDVLDRRFITMGFAAFVMLVPLALTSTDWSVKKLGARRWQKIHRLVYPIAIAACVHFLWLKRGDDWREPLAYLAIFAALFAARLFRREGK